jgi:hypothetical protein
VNLLGDTPTRDGPVDPDLLRIVDAWALLPDHIKAAIMALVQASH